MKKKKKLCIFFFFGNIVKHQHQTGSDVKNIAKHQHQHQHQPRQTNLKKTFKKIIFLISLSLSLLRCVPCTPVSLSEASRFNP